MIGRTRATLTSAALLAMTAGAALSGCTAKPGDNPGGATAQVAVAATDTACTLAPNRTTTGRHTFVITNNGTKVTEFYVYGTDNQVLAEAENISPGLKRTLDVEFTQPGDYKTGCKPGMTGDGIASALTITG
jgi:iron uptake system component EfeO